METIALIDCSDTGFPSDLDWSITYLVMSNNGVMSGFRPRHTDFKRGEIIAYAAIGQEVFEKMINFGNKPPKINNDCFLIVMDRIGRLFIDKFGAFNVSLIKDMQYVLTDIVIQERTKLELVKNTLIHEIKFIKNHSQLKTLMAMVDPEKTVRSRQPNYLSNAIKPTT